MLPRRVLNKIKRIVYSTCCVEFRDSQLNVYNFLTLRSEKAARFEYLRFDPNNNCNSRCVYCHNHRSASIVPTQDFKEFIENNVRSVDNFQMGCVMEPTMDQRLGDLLLQVATSPACPRYSFVLQSNGILLHKHDQGKIREAGLTCLSISIDSADPKIYSALRGGASISKLEYNIKNFTKNCPDSDVAFIVTVTQLNIASMESLVKFGMGLGVGQFSFREVFYHPGNDVVDHARMPALMLEPGDFKGMAKRLISTFGNRVSFYFADEESIKQGVKKVLSDSRR